MHAHKLGPRTVLQASDFVANLKFETADGLAVSQQIAFP
jgi:hypothetical protein